MKDSVPPKAEVTGSNPVGCASFPCRNLQEHAANKSCRRVQIPYSDDVPNAKALNQLAAIAADPDNRDDFLSRVVVAESGCWEWGGQRHLTGYGRYKRQAAHRVSYAMFNGPVPPLLVVRHACDNRPCVNPDHLALGTPQDNVRDAVERDRMNRWKGRRAGEANPLSKLTDQAVREIRALKEVLSQQQLADRYGISRSNVSAIHHGLAWSHVK